MNMILTSSSLLFPLISVPYVSRVLSTSGMGYVAFAQSFSSYFCLIAMLGMTYYGVRACSAVRDDPAALSKTVKELLILLFISSSIVTVFYIIFLIFVPQLRNQSELFVIFGFTIWLGSFGAEWFYQALEQYDYITVRSVCFKILSLILMFLLIHSKGDYVIYGCIIVFAGYGSNILNLLRLFKLVDFKQKQKLDVVRHLKPMFWFMVAAVSSGMYIQVDLVMLGFIGSNYMVGIYQLVSKIKSVLVTAMNSVGNVMLPRLSYYQANNRGNDADQLIAKNFNFVIVCGLYIIAILILCADPIVAILGGNDFAFSAVPLRFVGPSILFSAMNIVLANHMISNSMEKSWATVNVLGLASAVIFNGLLIPFFGVIGAAISISLCEANMFLMRSFVCRHFLAKIKTLVDPFKVLFSFVASLVLSILFVSFMRISNILLSLFVPFFVFSIAYAILLLLFRERLVLELSKQFFHRFK
nr:flippase [Bifidobacterium goeldii]